MTDLPQPEGEIILLLSYSLIVHFCRPEEYGYGWTLIGKNAGWKLIGYKRWGETNRVKTLSENQPLPYRNQTVNGRMVSVMVRDGWGIVSTYVNLTL